MLLCQTQDPSREIFFWLVAIVVAAILLGVVALGLRKLLLGRDEPPAVGFTLSDLRRLHAEGELSDEEFATAKGRMIAQNRAMLDAGDTDQAPEADGFGETSADPVEGQDADADSPDKNG